MNIQIWTIVKKCSMILIAIVGGILFIRSAAQAKVYQSDLRSAMSTHGVTQKFIDNIISAGLENITNSELIAFRVHKVTESYINSIHDSGFSDIAAGELIAFKVHGIDRQYIENLKSLGCKIKMLKMHMMHYLNIFLKINCYLRITILSLITQFKDDLNV